MGSTTVTKQYRIREKKGLCVIMSASGNNWQTTSLVNVSSVRRPRFEALRSDAILCIGALLVIPEMTILKIERATSKCVFALICARLWKYQVLHIRKQERLCCVSKKLLSRVMSYSFFLPRLQCSRQVTSTKRSQRKCTYAN